MSDQRPPQTQYDIAFQEGIGLVGDRINLDGRVLPSPGFFERRRLVRALGFFEQAARVEPPFGAASFMAAKVEERLGHPEESLRWLRIAFTQAPGNVAVAVELGAALSRQGLHREAAEVLSKSAELNPEDPRIRCNLGLALLMSGASGGAVSAFERAVALEPNYPVNARLLKLAVEVREGRKPAPKTEADIILSL